MKKEKEKKGKKKNRRREWGRRQKKSTNEVGEMWLKGSIDNYHYERFTSFQLRATQLYTPLCRSIGLLVGWLVDWLVGRSVTKTFKLPNLTLFSSNILCPLAY